ncbi:MAG: 7-carboxy-7-deazaguanine synthase QueE [Desulfurococcaceae archaeon]|jgi:organic radical activating enzyme|nr:7-carboxy-7-deazaguanine synthase QueE [Desulfurococcaceae archaeon]
MRVSEVFVSVQGEGPSLGRPAVFLRLSGCNLSCTWCDTKYAWYGGEELSVDVVAERVLDLLRRYRGVSLLVVTGGEPLLQSEELAELLARLRREIPYLEVEVETNGTVDPRAVIDYVDRLIVSPKLSNSGLPEEVRRVSEGVIEVIRTRRDRVYVKVVVEGPEDTEELLRLVKELGVDRDRVYLMPQASTIGELRHKLPTVVEMAIEYGFRVSDRLQIVGEFR